MKKDISKAGKTWNSGVAQGDATQAEYFASIGLSGTFTSWCTTAEGVWISAGAAYGPQVEFKSEAAADEFIRENPGAFRAKFCGKHVRVSAPSVPLFVAAFKAAKALKAEATAPVSTPIAALNSASVDAAEWAEFKAFQAFKAAQKK